MIILLRKYSSFLYHALRSIYYYVFLLIFSLFRIEKKIVIINFNGKGYGDTGKYICNELIKDNNKYKIYWPTTKKFKNSLPESVNFVKFGSIKFLYHLATARIWINNGRFSLGIRKRKKQFYIQTWHGCIGFKKCEGALGNKLGFFSILAAKNDSKMANLFISNSIFCTNLYKNYFWYNGDILECGCPRNDIIINNNKSLIGKVKKFFGLDSFDKICLYAPTYRDNYSLTAYNINYNLLLKELKNKFEGNRKLLIRLHPDISYLTTQLSGFSNNIIDVTNYPDMQELLVAADFMITDYSSCVLDYALSGKPAIIYASDIEDEKKERDFFFRLEDYPFPIATNSLELMKIITNFDVNKYMLKLKDFFNINGLNETGKASEIIAKMINDKIS